MRILIFFFFALTYLSISSNSFAKSYLQNQQKIKTDTAALRKQKIDAQVKLDIARIDTVVHLSNDQKSQLKELFEAIVAKKFTNNTNGNNNQIDPAALNKEIVKEEDDAMEDIIRPKQLKVWNKAQGNMPNAGTR